MNTQNTPVHITLWHKGFWLLSFANLFVTMSVYALVPTMPSWLMQYEHFSIQECQWERLPLACTFSDVSAHSWYNTIAGIRSVSSPYY